MRGRESERERERETSIYCSAHLHIHWLILVCALSMDQTCDLGASGQHSNQLIQPARDIKSSFSCHCLGVPIHAEKIDKKKNKNVSVTYF